MRHSRFLQVFLLTVLCLTISGLAEAGKGGHPEQFPYPNDRASYQDPKKGCEIVAYEDGSFEVSFPGIDPAAFSCSPQVEVNLYDPTTMSNSAKKLLSTRTSYIELSYSSCGGYEQIPISSMTAAADSKKAAVTVNISDSSLQGEFFGPTSIRPLVVIDYESALLGAGFRLINGNWTATCSGRRILE